MLYSNAITIEGISMKPKMLKSLWFKIQLCLIKHCYSNLNYHNINVITDIKCITLRYSSVGTATKTVKPAACKVGCSTLLMLHKEVWS